MNKTFVLDTNVLLSDSNALFSFKKNDIVLPMIVLEELDRHKDRQDEVGRHARETSRKLTELTKAHKGFDEPIPIGENLGVLRILSYQSLGFDNVQELIPPELEIKSGDNQILAVCMAFQKKHRSTEMCLVSRDVLLRLKAHTLGINAEDYNKLHVVQSADNLFQGVRVLHGQYDLDSFYSKGTLEIPAEIEETLHPNEFLIVTSPKANSETEASAIIRYKGNGKVQRVSDFTLAKIAARNTEQKFAIDLLMDPSVQLVTIAGRAGTGKTLISISAGLQQVLDQKRYKSLVICRPIHPVGKDIGFLPGDKAEKLEPWTAPIKDNLRFLLSADGKKSKRGEETLQMLFENGTIEVEAMTYIRGRSIANAFLVVDECQNLNAHELKTIITRVGEGTKIVLTGDIEQIDNLYVDSVSNGLTVAIEKFKNSDLSGHVTLVNGERSKLASIAASIL